MSMCDKCIHDEVCGIEGNHEEAITYCADMIPKAKQERCEEAISRQSTIDAMIKRFDGENAHDQFWNCDMVMDVLRDMPPVTPQQKYEDIAKAFQFGMALGFGERYDEADKMIDEIKKVIAPQPKTEETEKNGIKYLNINVSNSEVERNPDIVRLCADAGILEYVKPKMVESQESESKRCMELAKSYVQGLQEGLAESEE